jgi:2-polyprenyl-3-methyl-5-hydroxy-6-metoxy-1,4-benzoquinol methylase
MKCDNCNLHFTNPVYQTQLTSNLYDKLYRAEGSTTDTPNPDRLCELKKTNFAGSDKNFKERIEIIDKIIEKHSLEKSLLEVGSSWGYFLYQTLAQGISCTGIEISDTRRQYGVENLNVDIVDSFKKLKNKYSVCYTSHVLEHFTDLSSIFDDIHKNLCENGILLIEVPNFDIEMKGNSILGIIGAIHPLGFSSDFFQKTISEYGFEIINISGTWSNIFEEMTEESVREARLSSNLVIYAKRK